MGEKLDISANYVASDDIVARKIEDEFILVPVTSEVGGEEDALFSLNKTGQAIWDCLDGEMSLREIMDKLSAEFEGPGDQIEADVLGLVAELLDRKMVVRV